MMGYNEIIKAMELFKALCFLVPTNREGVKTEQGVSLDMINSNEGVL